MVIISARPIVGIVKKITMNNRAKSNSIRIIAGQWRGRKLAVADSQGLRPTTDRVRETLFNWLAHDLPGARCLDLFAGTGVLGLESLSRGASHVQFVEVERAVAGVLKQNIELLDANQAQYELVQQSALALLQQKPAQGFDVVFLDPPFQSDILTSVIELLDTSGWLNKGATVYIEHATKAEAITVPQSWSLHRQGKAGQSAYFLYHCLGTSD